MKKNRPIHQLSTAQLRSLCKECGIAVNSATPRKALLAALWADKFDRKLEKQYAHLGPMARRNK